MNKTERKREMRRQNALERLGTNNPRCHVCGKTNPHCLERHHIAGRAHANDTVIVCRNCHRELSDKQKDHPALKSPTSDPVERIAHFLLGLADLFELLVAKLREFGHALIERTSTSAEVRL